MSPHEIALEKFKFKYGDFRHFLYRVEIIFFEKITSLEAHYENY